VVVETLTTFIEDFLAPDLGFIITQETSILVLKTSIQAKVPDNTCNKDKVVRRTQAIIVLTALVTRILLSEAQGVEDIHLIGANLVEAITVIPGAVMILIYIITQIW